jgi:hypothetical protein
MGLLLIMTAGVCMSNVSDVQFTYLGAAMVGGGGTAVVNAVDP